MSNVTVSTESMNSNLRYNLRFLLLSHSAEEIHTTLRSIFQEDYNFYRTLFAPVPVPAPAPAQVPVPAPVPLAQFQVEEPITSVSKLKSDTKIRIVKKAVPEPEVVPVPEANDRERKAQIKKEQAEKVAEKNAEIVLKGVDPEKLLTKASLKKWIETDNLTYTQIARDHVGLSAEHIATVAKSFGFQSPIAKKRAMIIASRR